MKRIYIILAALMVFTSSCNSWLELEPENEVIKEDFWNTQEDVESVLWSAYSGMQKLHTEMLTMGEAKGDGVDVFNNATLQAVRLGMITADNETASWEDWYQIINFCNLIIAESEGVLDRDINYHMEEHHSLIAEAKTIRAFCYFYIVRLWKEAPLVTEAYDTDDQTFLKKKDTEETILEFCKQDLIDNLEYLKDSHTKEWEIYGRITKVAGQTLLADICLYKEDYQEAITYCDQVLNNRFKALEDGEDWFELFMDEFSNESIFEIAFDKSKDQKNGLYGIFYNNNKPVFTYAEHWSRKKLFADNDIRGEKASYNKANSYILKYVSTLPTKPVYISSSASDFNYKIYRLAEVYFMKAEAHVMLEQYDQAKQLMGVIRERAGLGNAVSVTSNVEQWLDFLLEEKLREFLGEGKRWFDLLRIGKKNNWQRKDLIIRTLMEYVPGADAAKVESMLQNPYAYYLPIHKNELEYNNLLEQNPYYK
ncbi:RagB/SusD family nutrient uptake outer membrane protein [Puteibacter caeruleilacunae]|nr:RagB/SusD family nutrient uptake outer membrane protein [Puteibacter caeruleilacunae]